MAVLTSFSSISNMDGTIGCGTDLKLTQLNLSSQNIKSIDAVYAIDQNDQNIFIEFKQVENIEKIGMEMVQANQIEPPCFEFKNETLHILWNINYITLGGGLYFFFTSTRLATPIETLDDPIDIPNSLVPLFVQKVLGNIYQLQGKEIPLSIKRRIKELE